MLLFSFFPPLLCSVSNNLSLEWTSKISLPKDYFTNQQLSLVPKDNLQLSYKTNQNNLINDDIMSEENSFGKQVGIYGLEFLGAGIGTFGASIAGAGAVGVDFERENVYRGSAVYAIGNIFLASSCTWLTGSLLKQNGSWWKSATGTNIGSLVGVPLGLYLFRQNPEGFMVAVSFGAYFVLPPLGSVIGYNIK